MDGGHQTLNNTKLVVDDFGEGGQAVGGAGGVRDLSNPKLGTPYLLLKKGGGREM